MTTQVGPGPIWALGPLGAWAHLGPGPLGPIDPWSKVLGIRFSTIGDFETKVFERNYVIATIFLIHATKRRFCIYAMASFLLKHCTAKNKFFAKVWNSQKKFADIAVPFWSGAQMSNAKLGMAHAATLK